MSRKFFVIYITAPQGAQAKKIAHKIVEQRAAACVNIVPKVNSIYRWNGRVMSDGESLLICKTTKDKFPTLKHIAKALHPYDLPEIIALPITSGHASYLSWVAAETI